MLVVYFLTITVEEFPNTRALMNAVVLEKHIPSVSKQHIPSGL